MKILFIFGTRPEAIKMAPVIKKFEKHNEFEVKVCVTAQHREMLDQVLNFFDIKPDYDLNIMKPNQTLYNITASIIKELEKVIKIEKPSLIFIQGDTTTAFVGALAGYYAKAKIAHIEAGLRSYNKYSPFPEEMNRVLIGHLADYHFAPTKKAKENLYKENIKKNVYVVGNTVIDALFLGLEIIKKEGEQKYYEYFNFIDFSKKIILVTGHRRESFGEPFKNICYAIKEIAENYDDVEIVYPVHLNPNVRKPVYKILKSNKRIHLIKPLSYPYFIWLMNKSYLVLTDSGGIQEEAPALGKPVLVMREITERTEGIKAGTAKLVGTDKEKIIKEVSVLLTNEVEYNNMAKAINPYGDGKASNRIRDIIKEVL
ncbi:MAG: hypothetical protein PWP54_1593 [Thermosipho sp. (in: thermotogales)]|uniref:non-hydrolyzing UDP-N-acetylglucosamine 2-epimerase n=1 Tax=Thermodesulfobacterium thermophilum TaxID=886 RepID=UPI0003B7476B|nr:UDP-N-acetylglucosamine 2-epimerase (non-hydrolyzing) [Thermodesulfobacterium thermophilum]MDK2887013.1 hypothetical protein [Thermosipho sp. (in: thermotogales)]